MKANSTLFGRWINFYNIMNPNLEEAEFSALYIVLESALRLIRDVLQRCNSDKYSFYISYAWELGNPENLQQRRFHAVLGLLESILQYLSGENSVFFDISDMQGNIEQTMDHAIIEKNFAILVGSPRLVTRVTNDMRSPAAFEFFKIMQRKKSEENRHAEREYQYIYYIMLDGEFHNAFPCVPKFYFPDQENIIPESFDRLIQKEKSLVSSDGTVRVCFSEDPIYKEMIFDARSIMEERMDMRAIHNFLEIIFGLTKPRGIIPTCANIGGVKSDAGIYKSYGAAVELMWSAIAGVQLRAAHTKFVRFSKKINDAKNAFPDQPNICSLLDKFFDEVTSISSRYGNIYSKLTEIDLLIENGSLDLAKKECAKSKVLARTDKEKELIEHLEKKVEGHQLMKLATSPQASDKELEKYIRLLLSADGIGRSLKHKSIALTTATVLLERVTDLKIKEQLAMNIRTTKGANLFFITSNEPWYTDREISTYLKMMIMSGDIGGYATNDQGILCSYLLKGENDGMFPDSSGQGKRFYVAVLPSVDNQKEFVAVDYFWDKERQSKNLIVTFLEKLLHDQRALHRLRQLHEDAFSSYISDQLETEQEIEHEIDSNIVQTIRDQLIQANFNTAGVLRRIEELRRMHSACRVDVLDELLPKLEGPNSAAKILFPYRHTRAHWWLGEIQLSHDENMQQDRYFVRFFAHDPYGGGTFKREHVLIFMRLFQRRIYEQNRFKANFFVETPQSPYGRRQKQEDNESCGLILCEDLLLRIRGDELPSKISNPSELKQKHEYNRQNNNTRCQSDDTPRPVSNITQNNIVFNENASLVSPRQKNKFEQKGSLPAALDIRGLKYEKIPGDGHCLYHAVGLYLGKDQALLRNSVAMHIEYNKENFQDFFSEQDRTLEDYLVAVRAGIEWAGHLEIEVLMQVLNRPIIVMESNGSMRPGMNLERFTGEPIFVLYNGHNHYDALVLDGTLPARNIYVNLHRRLPSMQTPATLVVEEGLFAGRGGGEKVTTQTYNGPQHLDHRFRYNAP